MIFSRFLLLARFFPSIFRKLKEFRCLLTVLSVSQSWCSKTFGFLTFNPFPTCNSMKPLDNANPTIVKVSSRRTILPEEVDDSREDAVTSAEIFDLIRDLNDPEHPLTLEQLAVVEEEKISVNDRVISVEFTPTVPHCSMATLIGLSIRVKLLRSLPDDFKVDVRISPGTHATEEGINKQLADKERVAAALENASLIEVVNQCLQERRRDA